MKDESEEEEKSENIEEEKDEDGEETLSSVLSKNSKAQAAKDGEPRVKKEICLFLFLYITSFPYICFRNGTEFTNGIDLDPLLNAYLLLMIAFTICKRSSSALILSFVRLLGRSDNFYVASLID